MKKPVNKNYLIEKKLKNFIEKETHQKILNSRADLIKNGIIDSFFMMRLIDFIERKFKINVAIEKLDSDNFNNLENIAAQINLWA